MTPHLLGKTLFGVTVWAVPGDPGQHLTWGGEHDMVRLCAGGQVRDGQVYYGSPVRSVSGRCTTLAEAETAAAAWLDQAAP